MVKTVPFEMIHTIASEYCNCEWFIQKFQSTERAIQSNQQLEKLIWKCKLKPRMFLWCHHDRIYLQSSKTAGWIDCCDFMDRSYQNCHFDGHSNLNYLLPVDSKAAFWNFDPKNMTKMLSFWLFEFLSNYHTPSRNCHCDWGTAKFFIVYSVSRVYVYSFYCKMLMQDDFLIV